MFQTGLGEAAQDRLRFCCPQPQCCRVLDHLIVLCGDEITVDRARKNELEVGIGLRLPALGAGQALRIDILEPRHELEAQQMAESKGHLVLAMGINKLPSGQPHPAVGHLWASSGHRKYHSACPWWCLASEASGERGNSPYLDRHRGSLDQIRLAWLGLWLETARRLRRGSRLVSHRGGADSCQCRR